MAPAHIAEGTARPSRRRELALNTGAVLGLLCIVAASLAMFLGIVPLVFRSGSMSPAITTGALALARTVPAEQLSVGDVVSVTDVSGVRITHRATGLEPRGDGSVTLTMRGDANDAEDPVPYVINEADRVFFHVNGLGYAVAWLSNPVAIFLGGMLAGALGVVALGRTRTSGGESEALRGADSRHSEGSHHG